jgi:cysteine desulfurase / selenocysteine lyase
MAETGDIDLAAVRADTPGCNISEDKRRVHFNNAGAALSPAPVIDAVAAHLQLEQEIGGYEAAQAAAAAEDAVYADVAALINARPEEIACVDNATRAWHLAFYSLLYARRPPTRGALIFTCATEYGSSTLPIAQAARNAGAVVRVLAEEDDGSVDVAALATQLHAAAEAGAPVLCVSLCWVGTNGGLVQPAAAVGAVCAAAGVPFLLDACQAVGQLAVDVRALRCDALSATGRKFLRGPRGIGFLYVRADGPFATVEPVFLDIRSAAVRKGSGGLEYDVQLGARRFEVWERSVALWLGLGAAVRYLHRVVGVHAAVRRIASLADLLREGLDEIDGVHVLDRGTAGQRCGIVGFVVDGMEAAAVKKQLALDLLNVSVSGWGSTALDMERRGLREVVRASVHYYNSEEEVASFLDVLQCLLDRHC